MTEVNSSSLSIQPLIHNVITNHFRLLHFDVHTEPVRGYLRRLLRARLLQHIARQQSKSNHPSDCGCWLPVKRCNRSLHRTRQIQSIIRIVDWLVQVWQRSNHFLETHHSSSVALGPRIFDTCPVDTPDAIRRWFEQLWNSSIAPYLIQAARDGLRKNHLRSQFEDPCEWIQRTYPWKRAQRSNTDESICSVTSNHDPSALLFSQSIGLTFNLRKILAEDIGMEVERDDDDEMSAEPNHLQPKSSQDVLSETLNKLQKCAIESN